MKITSHVLSVLVSGMFLESEIHGKIAVTANDEKQGMLTIAETRDGETCVFPVYYNCFCDEEVTIYDENGFIVTEHDIHVMRVEKARNAENGTEFMISGEIYVKNGVSAAGIRFTNESGRDKRFSTPELLKFMRNGSFIHLVNVMSTNKAIRLENEAKLQVNGVYFVEESDKVIKTVFTIKNGTFEEISTQLDTVFAAFIAENENINHAEYTCMESGENITITKNNGEFITYCSGCGDTCHISDLSNTAGKSYCVFCSMLETEESANEKLENAFDKTIAECVDYDMVLAQNSAYAKCSVCGETVMNGEVKLNEVNNDVAACNTCINKIYSGTGKAETETATLSEETLNAIHAANWDNAIELRDSLETTVTVENKRELIAYTHAKIVCIESELYFSKNANVKRRLSVELAILRSAYEGFFGE